MSPSPPSVLLAPPDAAARRRRVRRSAWLWGLIAAAFYFAFILMSLVRGWK